MQSPPGQPGSPGHDFDAEEEEWSSLTAWEDVLPQVRRQPSPGAGEALEDFALAAEALGLDASGGLPHWSLSFARSRNEFKKL